MALLRFSTTVPNQSSQLKITKGRSQRKIPLPGPARPGAGPVPALQVSVEPGCALLLDGRTRWRPADSSGARAFVVFEYADQGSSPWHAALTMARQAAAAAAMGIVPLPEIRTAESER